MSVAWPPFLFFYLFSIDCVLVCSNIKCENHFIVSVNFISNDILIESIYPNPTESDLNIQFNLAPNNATISIYNTLGECVLNETYNSMSVKINTSNFADGVYFISIRNGETVFQEKFIKQ